MRLLSREVRRMLKQELGRLVGVDRLKRSAINLYQSIIYPFSWLSDSAES